MALTLEETVVATLFSQTEEVANLCLHANPFLALLKEQGRVKVKNLGYEIRKPVRYNDTAVGGFYSGYENFSLDATDDFTAFQFPIRQVYEPFAISGREKRANQGDRERLLDHVSEKMEASSDRLKNTVADSVRSDGTGFGGREFDGLKKAVAASPGSGTYGGIDRATYTWAQNDTYTVSGGFSAANVQAETTAAIIEITRGSDRPDLGYCHPLYWKYLHSSLTAIQRINNTSKKALAGFQSLNYDGLDFVFDAGYSGTGTATAVESASLRLLNSKYWTFEMQRGADFKPLAPTMDRPIDQDAFFTVVIVEGNLCCSAPALQQYAV